MAAKGNGVHIPVAFSGPAQLKLYTRYGDPRDTGFESRWITEWFVQELFPWFPERDICVHKHFRPLLENAFRALVARGLHDDIKTCDKVFDIRPVRGSTEVLSVHSWGCAIDLNARDNPLGSTGRWSREFIEVMVNNSIFCGQNWIGRKDPMHFAMVNG